MILSASAAHIFIRYMVSTRNALLCNTLFCALFIFVKKQRENVSSVRSIGHGKPHSSSYNSQQEDTERRTFDSQQTHFLRTQTFRRSATLHIFELTSCVYNRPMFTRNRQKLLHIYIRCSFNGNVLFYSQLLKPTFMLIYL